MKSILCLAVWLLFLLLLRPDAILFADAKRRPVAQISTVSRKARLRNLLLRRSGENNDNEEQKHRLRGKQKKQQLQTEVSTISTADYSIIPVLLRPWVSTYRSIPKGIRLPFTNLDITFTVISAFCLTCLDYISAYTVSRVFKWPHRQSRAAGGSITTIFHSTVLTIGLFDCLRTETYSPSQSIHAHPQWWQDAATALIQFCTGYMLYDAMIQFIADKYWLGEGRLNSADWLFLGHHAGTALYMTSARLIQAGHMSAMSLMFLGELTAPIMNILRISKTAASLDTDTAWTTAMLPVIEYAFALLYVAFRVVIGPICAAHLTYDLLLTKQGRNNVFLPLTLVWLTLVWLVLIGSIPWIKNALDILNGMNSGGAGLSSLE